MESKTVLTQADLDQFTSQWFRHPLVRNVTYTEGVKYLADTAQAYWLIDLIATNQLRKELKAEPFQAWHLKVDGSAAILTCTDGGKEGNEPKVVFSQKIDYTDFPLREVKLWFSDNVILLPSEY